MGLSLSMELLCLAILQSLIGILVDFQMLTAIEEGRIDVVSIPDRDFSGFPDIARLDMANTKEFQSLIGILVDFQLSVFTSLDAVLVLFQSLIGILVDFQPVSQSLELFARARPSFNP